MAYELPKLAYAYDALEQNEEYYIGAHVNDAQLAAQGLLSLPRAPEPLSDSPPPPPDSQPSRLPWAGP